MTRRVRRHVLVKTPTAYTHRRIPMAPTRASGHGSEVRRDDGERTEVKVETTAEALAATLQTTACDAMRTQGGARVEDQLGEEKLPRVIHVNRAGVRRRL